MIRILILCTFLFTSSCLFAQDKSNKGKEFWLGYGYNYNFTNESPLNSQTLVIYISAEESATVTVSVNNTGWSQTVTIPAHTVDFSVIIPKSGPDDARILAEGLSTHGIHIVSDTPVVVYAHQYRSQLSGATMLMPVETYGYSYYSLNYTQTASNVQDWYSWFFIVASEDNTRLEITPSDTTQGGWIKGQTYIVNLNKGELYNVFGKAIFDGSAEGASKDLTGSKIVSVTGADGTCHPVAVFSGSSGIRLCSGDGGEFVQQQVFPANAWGTRYLTYHTLNNTSTNVTAPNLNFFRIAVQNPSTIVKKNGVILTGLIDNFYYAYSGTSGDYIEADKPVLVAQYMMNINQCTGNNQNGYGDPEMFYLSPIEQGLKKALFYNSRHYGIDYTYVNILLATAGLTSLLVDGASLPAANIIPHPTYPGYSVAVARLTGTGTQHSITSDSTFTATIYGLGIFKSYGYNVGCLVNNLNSYTGIKNTYNTSGNIDTFTCPRTQTKLFIKTAYLLTNIHWKLSQAGGGLAPNTDSVIANPLPSGTGLVNGRRYYTYTLQQDFTFTTAGTYYIPVTYESPEIDNCDHSETASIKVIVKPGPTTDFSVSAQNCLNDSIHFTGIPAPGSFNITGYNWNFDDNSSINTVNAVKLFSTPGDQHVRYRIFADNGCTGDTTKLVHLFDSPVAKFGFSNDLCQGDLIQFTDTSSVTGGNIVQWKWIFGDGNIETHTNGNAFYHQYSTAGNYTVSLIVTSEIGCASDTLQRSFTVLPRPAAKFGFDRNICLGEMVTFSDSSYVGQTLTSWNWDFGDGNTIVQTGYNPFTHNYLTAGDFKVSLVVNGSNGCVSDTFKLSVNVSEKPSAAFTLAGKPCIDSSYQFTSATLYDNSNLQMNWYWDFGDGQSTNITTTNTASHVYPNPAANITIKHAVTSGGCKSDTISHMISAIHPNPVADFTILRDTLCEKKPVSLTAAANPSITSWLWDFGNGTGTSIPPFTRIYAAAGTYTIKLVVKTADGCGSSPLPETINIAAVPNIDAGPDLFIKPGTSKVIQATIANPSQHSFLWSPGIFLNNTSILRPTSTPGNSLTYRVTATNKLTHCISYDSLSVKLISDIYVPGAFSPNGDWLNDTWGIPALEAYPDAVVTIYNRYGQMLFHSRGYTRAWDGTYKGAQQPQGSYIYIIQTGDKKFNTLKGTVTIVR